MKTLPQVIRDTSDIETRVAESEEDVLPFIEAELQTINLNMPGEIDAFHLQIERLGYLADMYDAQAKENQRISRSLSKVQERYKRFVKQIMVDSSTYELDGHERRYKLSKLSPKVVVEDDQMLIREGYGKEIIKIEVDKERVKEDLEAGLQVAGARLEDVYTLRNYPQKKSLE